MFDIVQDHEGRARRKANASYTLKQLLYLPLVFASVLLVLKFGWVWGLLAAAALNVVAGFLLSVLGIHPKGN